MEHQFLSETEGVWLSSEKKPFCRWKFDPTHRTIEVDSNGAVLVWEAPDLELQVAGRIELDIPETAKDIATYLRRRRSHSIETFSPEGAVENKRLREVVGSFDRLRRSALAG